MANEIVDAMRRANWDGLICKIDMKKSYDHVNWGYLDWVLGKMGFGSKRRNWIKLCISSPSLLVLVNGIPKGFWLRQGDSLSPYFFIIVVELLGQMDASLRRQVEWVS